MGPRAEVASRLLESARSVGVVLIKEENVTATAGAAPRSPSRYIADTHSLDDDAAMAAENFTAPNSEFLTRAVFGRACQKFGAAPMSSTFVIDPDHQVDFLQSNSWNRKDQFPGCWSTSCRQRVQRVVERNNHMLWFPVHYEGQECSKYIFYTGAVPNQQVEPAMDWLTRHGSRL